MNKYLIHRELRPPSAKHTYFDAHSPTLIHMTRYVQGISTDHNWRHRTPLVIADDIDIAHRTRTPAPCSEQHDQDKGKVRQNTSSRPIILRLWQTRDRACSVRVCLLGSPTSRWGYPGEEHRSVHLDLRCLDVHPQTAPWDLPEPCWLHEQGH